MPFKAALERRQRALEIDGAGMARPSRSSCIAPADHAAIVGEVEQRNDRRASRLRAPRAPPARLFATPAKASSPLRARERT